MVSVKQDIFPAFVAMAPADDPVVYTDMTSGPLFPKTARQITVARVVVFGGSITIAIDGNDGPKIVFREAIQANTFIKGPNPKKDSYVVTASGIKIAFRRDDACGCGSRLRSWNPYNSIHSSQDPTS